MTVHRRTLATTAWAAPVAVIATSAPAFATSRGGHVKGNPTVGRCKCAKPGGRDAFPMRFALTSRVTSLVVTTLTISGKQFFVEDVRVTGLQLSLVAWSPIYSATGARSGVLAYTVDGENATHAFTYSGTPVRAGWCS